MKTKIRYDRILNIDYLYEMYYAIRKTTKNKDKLFKFELYLSSNLISIFNQLKEKRYVHDTYNIFLIKDPKYRVIMSEKLPDKIVNHLISKYFLFLAIDYRLLDCNVATRIDMGTKKAYDLMKRYINKAKNKQEKLYVLKCDINKYFYSINHHILYQKLENIIDDKSVLSILQHIINTTDAMYVNENIEELIEKEKKKIQEKKISKKEKNILFNKLNQIPKYQKGYGLPIGNMSSQILAIFYLNDLDHYIKEKLKIKYYIRYMDDFILIHPDKNYLKECLKKIQIYLERLDLKLNHKTNIYDLNHGITFLGYRFFLKNKKLVIKIKRESKEKIKKKYKKLVKTNPEKFIRVKASYNGYLKMAHSHNLIRTLEKIEKNIK